MKDMRIAIITLGSLGDVQPYVAIGQGLRLAGHNVSIVAHTEFESLIRGRSLDFFPVTGNPKKLLEEETGKQWLESGTNPFAFFRLFTEIGRPLMMEILTDCWSACQDAHRIFQYGIGPRPIHRKHLTAERLANAIRITVTDNNMRQRAATIGSQIRAEDGVARAVEIVDRLMTIRRSSNAQGRN